MNVGEHEVYTSIMHNVHWELRSRLNKATLLQLPVELRGYIRRCMSSRLGNERLPSNDKE